jgi:voltage-gated potassium channel Kch
VGEFVPTLTDPGLDPATLADLGAQQEHRRQHHDADRRAAQESLPLRDAFSVLFFVSVGMLIDPSIIWREPLPFLEIEGNVAKPQILKAANLAKASCMVVAIPNAFEAGQAVQQARVVNPSLRIIARAHSTPQVGTCPAWAPTPW